MKSVSDAKSQSKSTFKLFERSSGGILNLKFDSKILEQFYSQCSYPRARDRFRFGSAFVFIACVTWLIYFCFCQPYNWKTCVFILSTGIIVSLISFSLSFVTKIFKRHYVILSALFAFLSCVLSLLPFVVHIPPVSHPVGLGTSIQLVLVLYTMIPLRLWHLLLICGPLSAIHLILSSVRYGPIGPSNILISIIAHLAAHAISLILHLMSQVWRRSTFLRLGYSALMDKELRKEKEIRDDMIRSLMPNEVAQQVMKDVGGDESDGEVTPASKSHKHKKLSKRHHDKKSITGAQNLDDVADGVLGFSAEFDNDEEDDEETDGSKKPNPISYTGIEGKTTAMDAVDATLGSKRPSIVVKTSVPSRTVTFRKFHVNQLENVSVLFADIVGFTKMSSNKTASHLVYLLNDLFGRFDQLCELTGCEKIATLGDCYYCVAGCPNPVDDHAERAVEMGRAMCLAIQQFDEDHNEQVNMRVGVHTGKVICGLVGTRRFKFDVWSNDVTLANEMESSGKAGKVHISESTLGFVKDIYEVSDGDPVPDIRKFKVLVEFFNKEQQCFAIKHTQDEAMIKTYFVERRLDEKPVCMVPRNTAPPPHSGDAIASHPPQNTAADPLLDAGKDVQAPDSDITTALAPNVTAALEDHGESAVEETQVTAPSRGSDAEMLDALKGLGKLEDVFAFPPISPCTLIFLSHQVELGYRRLGLGHPKGQAVKKLSWSTPRIAPLIYGTLQFLIFLLILITCLLIFPDSLLAVHSSTFYVVAGIALLINVLFMILLFADLTVWCYRAPLDTRRERRQSAWGRFVLRIYMIFFRWPIRNILGAVLLVLPSAVILSNFNGSFFHGLADYPTSFVAHYRLLIGLLFSFMLITFTLFISFSFWTKSLSACVACVVAMVLLFLPDSHFPVLHSVYQTAWNSDNGNKWLQPPQLWATPVLHSNFVWEVAVVLLLTLVLVIALNREFDISFRLSFHRDYEALQAKKAIAQQKIQADWLLENIIPYYIMEDLRRTQKYSQHIDDAAVIFATISNFAEFYDEQYQGGQEMLRVLNEIFADFEHLLALPKYKDVEKIKTIGACFMAASGLNMAERERNTEPDAHLLALMDFAFDLITTLDEFNRQMFNFQFELKVGYNIGEVTAGVIGTTKLLYDIWGDAVNVASRMYSTGQKGKIQVTEAIAKRLEPYYVFEYRGDVLVKGKGEMKTYLLVERRSSPAINDMADGVPKID